MMVRKGCPRCAGDLFVEADISTTDLVCLQCGHRRTIAGETARELSRMIAEPVESR